MNLWLLWAFSSDILGFGRGGGATPQPGRDSCMGKLCTGFTPMDTFAMRQPVYLSRLLTDNQRQPLSSIWVAVPQSRKGNFVKVLHLPTSYFWVNGYASCCVCKGSIEWNTTFHPAKKIIPIPKTSPLSMFYWFCSVKFQNIVRQMEAISYNLSHLIATCVM